MGGGGSRFSLNDGDLESLQAQAKSELKSADTEVKNVFISFDYNDIDEVNLLRGQVKNENTDLDFKDYSVKDAFDSENADYIKKKIRDKIKQTSATIVYLSDKTANSKWVNWEIEESNRLGKIIIPIYSGDYSPKVIPKTLMDLGITPIQWSHDEIIKKLNK
jgi:hypothetical protein